MTLSRRSVLTLAVFFSVVFVGCASTSAALADGISTSQQKGKVSHAETKDKATKKVVAKNKATKNKATKGLTQTPAPTETKGENDPLESVNRGVFEVNDVLDRFLLKPLAQGYRAVTPSFVRDRITGILRNMSEPVTFANNLLQGNVSGAGTTLGRFLINTTLGGAGMYEVANEFGLKQQRGDFGQTLYTWGLSEGPYLVLPLFGPSSARDAVGLGVDSVMSPWKYLTAMGGSTAGDTFMITDASASGLSRREASLESLDALREGALDFYAQMRSVYRQYRAKEIGAPSPESMPTFEDYDGGQTKPIVR